MSTRFFWGISFLVQGGCCVGEMAERDHIVNRSTAAQWYTCSATCLYLKGIVLLWCCSVFFAVVHCTLNSGSGLLCLWTWSRCERVWTNGSILFVCYLLRTCPSWKEQTFSTMLPSTDSWIVLWIVDFRLALSDFGFGHSIWEHELILALLRIGAGCYWIWFASMEVTPKISQAFWLNNTTVTAYEFLLAVYAPALSWYKNLRLDHLVIDQAKFLSPLSNSGYSDEDMVGKIKLLAVKSSPLRLGFQILERYSAYTCCRWLRGSGWLYQLLMSLTYDICVMCVALK